MAQQYGYGYGYGYGQGTVGYGVQVAGYGPPAAARPQQPGSYQVAAYTPKTVAPATPQPPPVAAQVQAGYYPTQPVGSSTTPASAQPVATPPHQQTQPATSYYGYQQYRPQAQQTQPATAQYAAYYHQQPTAQAATVKPTPTSAQPAGVGYGSSPGVAMGSVGYPSSYSSPYYTPGVSANRYGSYNSGPKASQPAAAAPAVKPAAPSYIPSSASYGNTGSYSSAQESVIANYIAQKTTGAAAGAGKVPIRRPHNPSNQAVFFCDICKISCASSMTYKTHLEGKAHKKKLNSQSASASAANGKPAGEGEGEGDKAKKAQSDKPHFCPLCEVQCTSKDSYEAHIRGTRHTKVMNLYKRLGKPIPDIKLPEGTEITTTVGGKALGVTAPRITFVGGQQLSSMGTTESTKGPPKVYPPGAPTSATKAGDGTGKEEGGEEQNAAADVSPEIEPVGEQFVIAVSNDPKFPHATYKCTMCDCYFNDEWARKAHAKGRRHRFNYKKLYQPDLYVEPTKSNRKKAEQARGREGKR